MLTREPTRARHLEGPLVELVSGDVTEPASLGPALTGVTTTISAMHGFTGRGGPAPVDWLGNVNLVHAAEAAGSGRFVMVSLCGAGPDHPLELARMKYRAEQVLEASSLSWTVVRASAFMELWLDIIGEPLLATGRATVFGRGDNPVNFVSVTDVAAAVELAAIDPAWAGQMLEVGGPENLSLNQFVAVMTRLCMARRRTRHVPRPVMRLAAILLRPVSPALARQVASGVVMDTRPLTFDAAPGRRRLAAITATALEQAAAAWLAGHGSGSHPAA